MSHTRRIGATLFGITALMVTGFTVYKVFVGQDVGFNEVVAISSSLMIFFSAITWGTKREKDGILQEEELGQKITEKSSKISYFMLTFFILGAVGFDKIVNGTTNIFLLILLGLSMITLPFIEFLISKKYQ